jgi:hypothetical protein
MSDWAKIHRFWRFHDVFHSKPPNFPLRTIILHKSQLIQHTILSIVRTRLLPLSLQDLAGTEPRTFKS